MRSFSEFPKQARDWLGKSDHLGEIYPLKHVVKSNQISLSENQNSDLEIEYIDISSVDLTLGIKKTEKLEFGKAPSRARRVVRSGDVLVSTVRTYLRAITRVEQAADNLIASTGFAVLTPSERFDSEYFGFYCTSHPFVEAIVAQSKGSSYPATNVSDIVRLPVAVPPIEKQREISAFIKRKLAEVDDLISKKQAMLKLLAEKRSSLITRAVTKGLNPDALMKSSGYDWLGDIPEHWEIKRLRFIGRPQNGINIGGEFFGKGHPFVSYSDVFNNFELPSNISGLVESSDDDRKRYSVQRGDIFFTRTSETIEEIGMSAVSMRTIPDATFAGFLIRVRPSSKVLLPSFAKYYFRNTSLRFFLVKEMNLVTRASLGQNLLGNLPVVIPSLAEQEQIVGFIETEAATLDAVTSTIESAILHLIEYRSSVISKAVTGELEVA